MKTQIPDSLSIDLAALKSLFDESKFEELSELLLSVCSYFQKKTWTALDQQRKEFIDHFAEVFGKIFVDPVFQPPEPLLRRFLSANAAIANLFALSKFETSDLFLEKLLEQQGAPQIKGLVLYSARNKISLQLEEYFDSQASLSSLWYTHFFDLYTSALAGREAHQNFRNHLNFRHANLEFPRAISRMAYAATYIDQKHDRSFKELLNKSIKERYPVKRVFDERFQNTEIAVVSACWRPAHAVYKNQFAFIDSLRDSYRLTFFPLREGLDASLFHEVGKLLTPDGLDLEELEAQQFRMIYFPDVGMSEHSVLMSNLRLAPIQACCYGHSVSTFGGEIDYYIVGEQVEDVSLWRDNYSERLVCLPGLGLINKAPDYTPSHPEKGQDRLLINCSWSAQKCNSDILATLAQIVNRVQSPLLFRFFIGAGGLRDNGYLPLVRDIKSCLGEESVELIPFASYPEYMKQLEAGHLALDSFHYGGCNTIIDSLFIGLPIISWMGTKWYNRVGGAQLRAIGLHELVVQDEQAYIDKACRLIDDADYRNQLVDELKSLKLLETVLFDNSQAQHFKRAIDYLMLHHQGLSQSRTREPIRFSL